MGYRIGGQALCSVCGSKAVARRLCRKHYTIAHRDGRLSEHATVKPFESFLSRIRMTDGCWFWLGTKNGYGYGIFLLPGEKPVRAHRYSYEFFMKTAIPAGKVVLHLCDNPACVNPAHLRVGSKLDNNRDCAIKGRKPSGAKHWNNKLTDSERDDIRTSALPQAVLARKYGISQSHVSRVRSGDRQRLSR